MSDEPPVTSYEALLQAHLERRLSSTEQQQLLTAIQQKPILSEDAALLGLLRELRLERRIAKHEDAAWSDFSQLAAQRKGNASVIQTTGNRGRWHDWLATLWSQLQPSTPALAAVVIVVQTVGLVWLSSSRDFTEPEAMRGNDVQTCPAVLVRFKLGIEMTDISRVLIQSQAHIVAGPDAAGLYRLQGGAAFIQDASTALQSVASEAKLAPECNIPFE